MFRHLNLRVRKMDPAGGHAGLTVHLGTEDDPARYSGLLQAELEGGVGLLVRAEAEGTRLVLRAGGESLALTPEELGELVRTARRR